MAQKQCLIVSCDKNTFTTQNLVICKDNSETDYLVLIGICEKQIMSQNKQPVQKYTDSFQETDYEKILSCLTQTSREIPK